MINIIEIHIHNYEVLNLNPNEIFWPENISSVDNFVLDMYESYAKREKNNLFHLIYSFTKYQKNSLI
jgi:hypothetical protein